MKVHMKSKLLINLFTATPILIFMWIIFGLNTNNVDLVNYERRFNYGTHEFAESGFNAIINIIKHLGIDSYQGFLEVLSLVLIAIIFCCILKFTDNIAPTLLLFCFYPFLRFCIEIRFSISFCIILIAILVLIKDCKYSIPVFMGLTLLATTIHSSSLLYLILVFHKVKISHRKKFYIIIGITTATVILTYTPIMFYLAYWVSGGSAKVTEWFTRHGRFGMVIPIAEQIISYVIFKYAYNLQKKHHVRTKFNADILYEINILMFILIPCYFINMTFFRLYRVILLINTIFYSQIIYYKPSYNTWKITRLGILNTFQILCLSLYEIFSKSYVWKPFFEENQLFNKLNDFFTIIL